MAKIYIDEDKGLALANGATGEQSSPYQSLTEAFLHHSAEVEYRVRKDGEEEYQPAAKSALKKAASYAKQQQKKQEAAAKRAEEKEVQDAALVKAARSTKITENLNLPAAVLINVGDTKLEKIGLLRKSEHEPEQGVKRIRVQGRVHRVAKQGSLLFITLRRGLDLMQCLLAGDLARTYDAITLSRETSIEIVGELWEVPEGLHAPLDRELHADFFRVISRAASGDDSFTNKAPEDAEFSALVDQRHLALRHDKPSAVMFVREVIERAFIKTYEELGITKVSPPALVQTQVEGGATLFKLEYYGEQSYLTQSSQLYLETVLPSLGDVYCIEKSFRAEKSLTRRHVSSRYH